MSESDLSLLGEEEQQNNLPLGRNLIGGIATANSVVTLSSAVNSQGADEKNQAQRKTKKNQI